jgi:hypothetical protein
MARTTRQARCASNATSFAQSARVIVLQDASNFKDGGKGPPVASFKGIGGSLSFFAFWRFV